MEKKYEVAVQNLSRFWNHDSGEAAQIREQVRRDWPMLGMYIDSLPVFHDDENNWPIGSINWERERKNRLVYQPPTALEVDRPTGVWFVHGIDIMAYPMNVFQDEL